jgi:hypothetical protein
LLIKWYRKWTLALLAASILSKSYRALDAAKLETDSDSECSAITVQWLAESKSDYSEQMNSAQDIAFVTP